MTGPARVRDIVIVGGGTAGWMTAAALAKVIGTQTYSITLVESDEIGTVGVGEATIPPILLFNKLLGIDENEFIRETNATFKLGIQFVDWGRPGHTYMHPFGLFGADMNGVGFSHYWLRAVAAGGDPDNHRFVAEAEALRLGRFMRTPQKTPDKPQINYAFQFDASLYAAYLRRFSEKRGVKRTEGKISTVARHPESGLIESVTLADGSTVRGDFFVDCSGFRGLLIEGALQAGYEDWTNWLPANRAVAVPCDRVEDPGPYTRSTAVEAGWQWRIPLQHRTGNGYVFSDAFISEDEATAALMRRLDAPAQAEPRVLRFVAGRRRKGWVANCVAIGLSSGFLEPLESTSIHLIQAAISKLLALFPTTRNEPELAERFNRDLDLQYESVRDFIIAHYKVSTRDDTPFWRHCRDMAMPDTLQAKLESFRARGEVMVENHELFRETNWFAILYGQGLVPEGYHPLADVLSDDELKLRLAGIRAGIERRVAEMPSHEAFLRQCLEGVTRR
ncbi:tryptophan halogenase [Brevundimonas alba]|uniref:Tryptophan halogenase n=1 Tax=Brevundimonas alba TaxID=74314 RepID=A0A7X5YM87_9CAUL|nr:tryptophan halogenase family protein [Brevundimonas alba]NJC41229.1 tryptophan halogenase [Brevundimonas alba]